MAEKKLTTAQERIEKKKTLAGERNTRVLFADIPDTHRILDMATALNRGVKALRNQLGFKIPFEKGIELLKELKEMEITVHKTTQKICDAVGLKYKAPRAFRNIEDSKTEKTEIPQSLTEDKVTSKL